MDPSPLLGLLALVGMPGAAQPVPVGPGVAIMAVLLVFSAFFSGSETAIFSLQPIDRDALSSPRVDALLQQPRRTLASLLIGNEFVNVTLSTISAGLLLTLAPQHPWLNIVVLTPLLLVLGEVLPKVTALRLRRPWARAAAPFLLGFARLVAPIRWALTGIANQALRLSGGSTQAAELHEAQLRTLIDQGRAAGSIEPIEQEMLHKVFEFGDLTVSRLMTPRPDMFSLSLTTPWPDLVHAVQLASFSRVPVYRGRPDEIVGVLLVKKLLPLLRASREGAGGPPSPQQVHRLLHPARFVPTTKRAEDLLAEFRAERSHMAIVVDEHGSVVGIITLDDLLAELVGELLDEDDTEDPEVTEVQDGVWTVKGSMDRDDFAEHFGIELPQGDFATVGGFLLDHLGELPTKGTEFTLDGLLFRVSGIEGRRITEVCVCRHGATEGAP